MAAATEHARDRTRTAVLDAARDLLSDRPWSAVSMAAVAGRAGVSRQTVYNELGGREGLAAALVLREVDRFVAAVHEAVAARAGAPGDAIRAGFDVFLAGAAADPVVRPVLRGEPGSEELQALVTTHGDGVVVHATARLEATVREVWPHVAPADARLVAESVVRLAISLATVPPADPALTGELVGVLLPFAERALAQAG